MKALRNSKRNLQAFLDGLNPQQRAAVTADEGPVLVIAGAGSGKTRVLTGRAFYLIAEMKVHPAAIAVMTFTNKAAGELQKRLEELLGNRDSVPWAGTFHGFCARLLRQYGDTIGLPRDYSIYDQADSEKVVAELLIERKYSRDEIVPSTMRNWISVLKSGGALSGRHRFHKLAAELVGDYDKRLRSAGAVDFDDLLLLPLELFRVNPEILSKLQHRYDHILIDEFQDTNRIQYNLARAIAAPQNNLYVVGDDDQSIYGWRGADIRNLIDFQRDFKQGQSFSLEQNYRSTQQILDVANDVIAAKNHHNLKQLWTEKTNGEQVVFRQHSRAADEANEVVGEMDALVNRQGMSWSDFAVLLRTNSLSRYFEEVLISQSIPYTIVGGTKFYDRREVKDLTAFLRVLSNPGDEQAWKRILKTPPKGIGEVTIARVVDRCRRTGMSFGEVIADAELLSDASTATRNRLEKLSNALSHIAEHNKQSSLSELAADVLRKSGLIEYYEEKFPEEADDRVANLYQFIEAAKDREAAHPEYSLSDFLSEIALVSDIDDYNEAANRVTLMTMHAAKGLEFPVVFAAALEDNLLPHSRSSDSIEEIEEERRLFYVAITRAQDRLYLSASETRALNGQLMFQEPSRFLRDIDPSRLKGWTLPREARSMMFEPTEENYHTERPSYRSKSKNNSGLNGASLIPYKIGDIVEHPDFGMGVVTAKSGSLDSLKVRVAFEGVGSKLLALKYATLRKVE
ncbi:UvrD-helicase domain-containing protein [bacterium]|nr:UvrD-helicase domain-containing protein [bacterium]